MSELKGMHIKMENVLVSVCCATFNQEDYIAKVIEGFLMQKKQILTLKSLYMMTLQRTELRILSGNTQENIQTSSNQLFKLKINILNANVFHILLGRMHKERMSHFAKATIIGQIR